MDFPRVPVHHSLRLSQLVLHIVAWYRRSTSLCVQYLAKLSCCMPRSVRSVSRKSVFFHFCLVRTLSNVLSKRHVFCKYVAMKHYHVWAGSPQVRVWLKFPSGCVVCRHIDPTSCGEAEGRTD
ncbi:unnamed protein product [Ectocarpus fasciculatus]